MIITEKRGVKVSEQIIGEDLPTHTVIQSDVPDSLFAQIVVKANVCSPCMALKVKINNIYGITK